MYTLHYVNCQGFKGLRADDIDRDFPRIEEAFQKYIGGASWLEQNEVEVATSVERPVPSPRVKKAGLDHDHEYEIVVGRFYAADISSVKTAYLAFALTN